MKICLCVLNSNPSIGVLHYTLIFFLGSYNNDLYLKSVYFFRCVLQTRVIVMFIGIPIVTARIVVLWWRFGRFSRLGIVFLGGVPITRILATHSKIGKLPFVFGRFVAGLILVRVKQLKKDSC